MSGQGVKYSGVRSGLDRLLRPESVAVIGASDDHSRVGGKVFASLLAEFDGMIVPVNRRGGRIQGVEAVLSIKEVSTAVDLAVIAVPPAQVESVIADCAAVGVGAAIVLSAGFGEAGEEGRAAQDRIERIARETGMRVVGPNCFGVINLDIGLFATFATRDGSPERTGAAAVISQSGHAGLIAFQKLQTGGVGTTLLAMAGNEADVTAIEIAREALLQKDLRVVALVLEGIKDPESLLALGTAALELGKVVVLLKLGTTAAGARAAMSHTGAMSSADDVVRAATAAAGIVQVDDLTELVETVKVFAAFPSGGTRIAISTGSGGLGVMMADLASNAGLELPETANLTRERLRAIVPENSSLTNPLDFTGNVQAYSDFLLPFYETLANAVEFDVVVATGISRIVGAVYPDALVRAARTGSARIAAWSHQSDLAANLTSRGVPTFEDAHAGMKALASLAWHDRWRSREPEIPSRGRSLDQAGERRTMSETASASILMAAGLVFPRQQLVSTPEEAISAWREFGRPVAMKLNVPEVAHKSDVGGVRLGVDSDVQVDQCFHEFMELSAMIGGRNAAAPSVLVQEMIPKGIELVVGAFRDPGFGPVVVLGLGGTLVEIVAERVYELAPLTIGRAESAVRRLSAGRLVNHHRGIGSVEVTQLAELLVAVGDLMMNDSHLAEVEVNPVIIGDGRVTAVDALVVVAR